MKLSKDEESAFLAAGEPREEPDYMTGARALLQTLPPPQAEQLAALLRQNRPPKDILTVEYEPVTGSHVGPGALALFFLSEEGVRSYNGESMTDLVRQAVARAGGTASETLNKLRGK